MKYYGFTISIERLKVLIAADIIIFKSFHVDTSKLTDCINCILFARRMKSVILDIINNRDIEELRTKYSASFSNYVDVMNYDTFVNDVMMNYPYSIFHRWGGLLKTSTIAHWIYLKKLMLDKELLQEKKLIDNVIDDNEKINVQMLTYIKSKLSEREFTPAIANGGIINSLRPIFVYIHDCNKIVVPLDDVQDYELIESRKRSIESLTRTFHFGNQCFEMDL